jgi:predicted phosphodiesterase
MQTTLGVISDIHIAPPGTPPAAWHNPYPLERAREMLAAAVARCTAAGVDAVVLLGDLAHAGDLASITAVIEETAPLDVPVHVLPGNHDFIHAPDALRSTVERHGSERTALAPAVFPIADELQIVTMMLEQLETRGAFRGLDLPDVLAANDALVLFTHFPLLETIERLRQRDFPHPGDLHNRLDLEAALAARTAPTVVVHGHLHVRDAHATGPVLQLGCAALIEPPHEVTFLEIARDAGDAGSLTVTRRAESVAAFGPELRLPVLAPDVQTWRYRYADGAWSTADTP